MTLINEHPRYQPCARKNKNLLSKKRISASSESSVRDEGIISF
jgi:hypothetical protein